METPLDAVRITLTYADGGTATTPTMWRWLAEWLMANEIASGFYNGRRVASARIITV
jgi:hypothetical protein